MTNGTTSYNHTSADLSAVTMNYDASHRNREMPKGKAKSNRFETAPSTKVRASTPSALALLSDQDEKAI